MRLLVQRYEKDLAEARRATVVALPPPVQATFKDSDTQHRDKVDYCRHGTTLSVFLEVPTPSTGMWLKELAKESGMRTSASEPACKEPVGLHSDQSEDQSDRPQRPKNKEKFRTNESPVPEESELVLQDKAAGWASWASEEASRHKPKLTSQVTGLSQQTAPINTLDCLLHTGGSMLSANYSDYNSLIGRATSDSLVVLPTESDANVRPYIRQIAMSDRFERLCGFMIIANCAHIGFATDAAARSGNPYHLGPGFLVAGCVFSVWFILEISVRIFSRGIRHFACISPECWWNRFDLLVVPLSVLETILECLFLLFADLGNSSSLLANVSAWRLLRVLRMIRTLRVFRIVRWLRELRVMIIAIGRSVLPLMWFMLMLATVVYSFALYITQQQAFYLHDEGQESEAREDLESLYGNIIATSYTLYMCVTSGIDWGDAASPLHTMWSVNSLFMCFFIFFVNIAIMNVITAVFVQGAIDSAVADKEELIEDQLNTRDSELKQLHAVFKESDVDNSGTITKEEFTRHCQDRRVRALLRALGLNVDMAQSLFKLLDVDHHGELPIEQLVIASMRLKGQASAMDVAVLMHETKEMSCKLQKRIDHFGGKLDGLTHLLRQDPLSF